MIILHSITPFVIILLITRTWIKLLFTVLKKRAKNNEKVIVALVQLNYKGGILCYT